MLASLLRRMILSQVLIGAGVGYWLASSCQWPMVFVALIAIALPFAIMILVDTISGLISREPKEPSAMWWKSLFGEFYAGILIFLFRQPWSTAAPTVLPATSTQAKVPVVLVHGYMCNHRIWDDMASRLRAQGHAVFAVNLEPLFTSIDNYAPIVEAAMQALTQHTGQRQVAMVGHSMGGLAIRAWMRVHGIDRIARVLTLGTPHAGTKLAKGSPAPNARQMMWQSAWLATLAAGESAAIRGLVRIALTPQDNIVCPQRAQVLEGVTPTVFEGIGHVQMCIDADVMAWVQAELASLPSH
jgi:pimeloyl-ACP methyl ester carboxylesterase